MMVLISNFLIDIYYQSNPCNGLTVVFEPTDVEISDKPFKTEFFKAVKVITPNLNELKHLATTLNIPQYSAFSSTLNQTAYYAKEVAFYVENVIVTLGPAGVLIARKSQATDPFLKHQSTSDILLRYYPCKVIKDVVNVSGAGDCLTSGIIAATLEGLPEERCVSVGFAAAQSALYSQSAVPKDIFDKTHESWNLAATYETINV